MEHVVSADGVRIAYQRTGTGPPLVLVHGAMGDHSRWDPLVEHLTDHFTVYAMDRRGRGESGDAEDYSLELEYDDVAAVARSIDSPVDVYGHSYGVYCALGAAPKIPNLRRLVLYEGPLGELGDPPPNDLIDKIQSLVDEGRREEALITALRDVVQMAPEDIEEYRSLPSWPARIEAVHTFAREERVSIQFHFDHASINELGIPILLLKGTDSPRWFKDSVDKMHSLLPGSQVRELPGQQHAADVLAPEMVASALIEFLNEK
jgi:pimeloyl-ACP methyl ester carboxylesterase